MTIAGIFRYLIFVVVSLTLATSAYGFDCGSYVKKYEWCNASFQFIEAYQILCSEGNELEMPDLNSMHKFMAYEMSQNDCLARAYRPPQVNRRERQKVKREMREFKRDKARERRQLQKEEYELRQKARQEKALEEANK